jgi:hypothetical protein
MASGGVILTKKHAGIFGCICDIFQLNRSINTKWQFLGCASIAFRERHEKTRELRRKMSVLLRKMVWTDNKEERTLTFKDEAQTALFKDPVRTAL